MEAFATSRLIGCRGLSIRRLDLVSFARSSACFRRASFATSSDAPSSSEPIIRTTNLPAPGSGHIRLLELNRPTARNAISRKLLTALRDEIDAVHAQYDATTGEEVPVKSWNKRFGGVVEGEGEIGPTRALILASAIDGSFCAGADLKERRGMSQDETAAFLTALRATFASLAALPIPTISAIASVALGGGLELALSTHLRVMSSNAVVGLPETRLAILPGAGGTYRLPSLIGIPRARDMILTGRRVSGPEAYFLGLTDRLVEVTPQDEEQGERWKKWIEQVQNSSETQGSASAQKELDAEVMAQARPLVLGEAFRLATEICEGGPVAVRAALQAVSEPSEVMENTMYGRVVATDDRNEALKAFAEKRKPHFTGR